MTLRQTHSAIVHCVADGNAPAEALEGDALFTDSPGAALGAKVADCLPIYIFSEDSPVIGLAHAGWRGTLARIVAGAAGAITAKLGVTAASLLYSFGPCIAATCYEVGPEVADAFQAEFPDSSEFITDCRLPANSSAANGRECRMPNSSFVPRHSSLLLDLRQANRQILNAMGLREVPGLDLCTHCLPDQFFSARRDGATGRNMAVIVLTG